MSEAAALHLKPQIEHGPPGPPPTNSRSFSPLRDMPPDTSIILRPPYELPPFQLEAYLRHLSSRLHQSAKWYRRRYSRQFVIRPLAPSGATCRTYSEATAVQVWRTI